MEQILVRKLSPGTRADYRAVAEVNGRSLEAELRALIERNRPRRRLTPQEREELSRKITAGQKMGTDSTQIIREAREQLAARHSG
jgi:plasmid stability protein